MIWRINKKKTFAELRNGHSLRSKHLTIHFVGLPTECPQLGFAFGRSFGNAVERNKAKRRLRAAFRTNWVKFNDCVDLSGAYLITGSRNILKMSPTELNTLLDSMMKELEELVCEKDDN